MTGMHEDPARLGPPIGRSTLGHLVDSISQGNYRPRPARPVTVRTVCVLTLILAAVIFGVALLAHLPVHLGAGVAVVFLGIVSGWAQLSFSLDPPHERSRRQRVVSVMAILLSITVTVLGIMFVFLGVVPLTSIGWGVLAGFMIVCAVAIIVEPWWMTLLSDLGAQRMRASEEGLRAEIASHLHDSVLQTLALIQLNVDDAEKVRSLAHGQERDLREWLYGDQQAIAPTASEGQSDPRPNPWPDSAGRAWDDDASRLDPSAGAPDGDRPSGAAPQRSFVGEIRHRAALVEDRLSKVIEVVSVGDIPYSERLIPLADASREALLNAAAHGREPISLYTEVQGSRVEVFIRDHGDGFDVQNLPEGHFGVAQSIVGRLNRAGGSAQIVSRPGWGTEVHLSLRDTPVARSEPSLSAGPTTSAEQHGVSVTPTG